MEPGTKTIWLAITRYGFLLNRGGGVLFSSGPFFFHPRYALRKDGEAVVEGNIPSRVSRDNLPFFDMFIGVHDLSW